MHIVESKTPDVLFIKRWPALRKMETCFRAIVSFIAAISSIVALKNDYISTSIVLV
jgi:hypothetical protein